MFRVWACLFMLEFAGSFGFRIYGCKVLSLRLQSVQGAVLGVGFLGLGVHVEGSESKVFMV